MKRLLTLSAAAFVLVVGVQAGGKLSRSNESDKCGNKCEEILKFEKAAAEARRGRKIHLVDLNDKR
jgi:hypothetical protein